MIIIEISCQVLFLGNRDVDAHRTTLFWWVTSYNTRWSYDSVKFV